jgi:hypothetical protein
MIGQHQPEPVTEFLGPFVLDIFLKEAAITFDLDLGESMRNG